MSESALILVVDDEDSVADMVADALRDEGYEVAIAFDGRGGLEIARQQRPLLILSDVMMPFMDGIKMAQLLQQDLGKRTPPIIFMSAVDCRAQVKSLGSFLAKPFTIDALLNAIDAILRR